MQRTVAHKLLLEFIEDLGFDPNDVTTVEISGEKQEIALTVRDHTAKTRTTHYLNFWE